MRESERTKLRRPLAILCDTSPIIRPRLIPPRAQRNHRLNCKAHALLRRAYSLVLRIMRHVGSRVEELVDAVAAVRLDDAAVERLGVLLDHVARVAEQHAGFYDFDGLVETLARALGYAHGVGVGACGRADVVGFV